MKKMINAIRGYRYGDNIVGKVIDYDSEKCYVRDRETDAVVCYKGCGEKGDVVMLSVKWKNDSCKEVLCVLDSVLEYADVQVDDYFDKAG